jgi:cytoskeletal protein RodZ
MKEIGQQLREARERQGVPLARVYEATRINPRYVAALEAGEFEVIPGEVYLKGFLREYARLVGLDGEELVRQYRERAAALAPPPVEPVRKASVAWQPPRRVRVRPARSTTGRRLLALFAVGLAALATGWALAIWSVDPVPEPSPARPDAVEQGISPEATPASPPAAAALPADRPAAVTPAPPPSPVQVTARLTGRCWVRVEADGRVIYQGEPASGAELTWGASDRLTVKLGNPAGIRLAWNGRSIDLPAEGPVTRTFSRDGLVAPAPAPAPRTAPSPAIAPAPATPAPTSSGLASGPAAPAATPPAEANPASAPSGTGLPSAPATPTAD